MSQIIAKSGGSGAAATHGGLPDVAPNQHHTAFVQADHDGLANPHHPKLHLHTAADLSGNDLGISGEVLTLEGLLKLIGGGGAALAGLEVDAPTTTGKGIYVLPGNGLTTGSGLYIDIGSSAPGGAVNAPRGLGLYIVGTGAFAGLGNVASLVKFLGSGAFTGKLLSLSADNTVSGKVLEISAASLASGRALDIVLAATYTDPNGAVRISAGGVTGTLAAIAAGADTAGTSDVLAVSGNFSQGRLLHLWSGVSYMGLGAIFLDLSAGAGGATGTGMLIRLAATADPATRFIDLQEGVVSRFAVQRDGKIRTSLPADSFVKTDGAGVLTTGVPVAALPDLAYSKRILTADFVLPANTSAYISEDYEIAAGVTLEAGAGACVEVG